METGTVSTEDQHGVYIWSLYLREQAQERAELECTLNKHSGLLKKEGASSKHGYRTFPQRTPILNACILLIPKA